MRPLKWLGRRRWGRRALGLLIALYIKLVWRTSRWRDAGPSRRAALGDGSLTAIVVFWHGRLLMMPPVARGLPVRMLISGHRDGRIIADTLGHFGLATVAGSTARGGSRALRAVLRLLAEGITVGFTPDGPRGPRMRASAGAAAAARLAGVPVLPVAYGHSRRRVLGSWDRFVLPLPFGRGVFVWGRPIDVPRDGGSAALEAARRSIEEELNRITREADRLCGVDPVEPAPPEAASAGPAPCDPAPPEAG